jgi:hypothetical protein
MSQLQMSQFFQYVTVLLTVGDQHSFQYNIFIPCSETGLTDEQIQEFLTDRHDVREDMDSDGLKEGNFWTHNDTAASVTPCVRPINGKTSSSHGDAPIYCADNDLCKLYDLAPELFYDS